VTTIGYGDVTLARTSGRIVAAFVMLQGIVFLTIRRERIDARFDDLAARLDRLEGMIARLIGP
jgi:voltage-gated potassium channel Kch